MVQQLSTSFSDFLLTVSCVFCIRQLMGHSQVLRIYAKSGYFLILVAASLGVIRFAMESPPPLLIKSHKYASHVASVLGLSCLAAEFYHQASFPLFGNIHLYAAVSIMLLQVVLSHKTHSTISEFVSSAAVVSILLICSLYKNVSGCLGAALIIFVGLAVGTEGYWLGLPAVDFFHYGLVFANYCLVQAVMKKV